MAPAPWKAAHAESKTLNESPARKYITFIVFLLFHMCFHRTQSLAMVSPDFHLCTRVKLFLNRQKRCHCRLRENPHWAASRCGLQSTAPMTGYRHFMILSDYQKPGPH